VKALLVLRDGTVYQGMGFGAEKEVVGELVFTTSMTGYQESLTDPSYAGQILAFTYPLIGNYGISRDDFESRSIFAEGCVVREHCKEPVHANSIKSLDLFLKEYDKPGIAGIDTRSIVRKMRYEGVTNAVLMAYHANGDGTEPNLQELIEKAKNLNYGAVDFVKKVTIPQPERYGSKTGKRIVLIDSGAKMGIVRYFADNGCEVVVVPCTYSKKQILSLEPAGILLSNGPGDPAHLHYISPTVRQLAEEGLPILGVCLGNQLVSQAFGGKTFKLKFGHRGANHPVLDKKQNKVYITTQNHGYAVDPKSLPEELEVTHVNCNDGTVEGVRHRELEVSSVQYHPEANPGPLDSHYIFDEFIVKLAEYPARRAGMNAKRQLHENFPNEPSYPAHCAGSLASAREALRKI